MSTISVPFEYKNFCPLSAAEKVTPVPETVLNSTVKAPVVLLFTI
jgi:hypothetical protein